MYILDTNALVAQLKDDAVSERDGMLYLLAVQLLGGVSLYAALYSIVTADFYFYYEAILYFVITVGGIVKSYYLNGGAGGVRFIEKFICLSWPLSIKVMIGVWLVTYGWFALAWNVWEAGRYEEWGAQAIFLVGELIFFSRMWVHMRRTTDGNH